MPDFRFARKKAGAISEIRTIEPQVKIDGADPAVKFTLYLNHPQHNFVEFQLQIKGIVWMHIRSLLTSREDVWCDF